MKRVTLLLLLLFPAGAPLAGFPIMVEKPESPEQRLGPGLAPLLHTPYASLKGALPGASAADGLLRLYVHIAPGTVDATGRLAALGFEAEIVDGRLGIAQGVTARENIPRLLEQPFVLRITLADTARPKAGAVTSEGAALIGADQLQERGLTGSGIRVGVLSDGIDSVHSSQASLDLPQPIHTVGFPGEGDEGTALLEIVHDLAPGAELGFCGARTSLEFIACIEALTDEFQADILVEDLGFRLEPFFEDGPVAQAATDAVRTGVLFISAAGNDALQHYQALFQGSAALGLTDAAGRPLAEHNFGLAAGGASDPTLDITIPAGKTLELILQWNDPFNASTNDYDLFLIDANGTVVADSALLQNGDDQPLEVIIYDNLTAGPQTLQVVVVRFSGEERVVEFFINGARLDQYVVPQDSIWGQSAARDVLSVGAINANEPGNDAIAPYSSRGPILISFPERELRQGPGVTGIDAVSVTGAGGLPVPFFGTSAAAPHVAGVAALLAEAFPALEAQALKAVMLDSAVDLGEPGADNVYGAGRIDAVRAYDLASGWVSPVAGSEVSGTSGCFIATAAYGSRWDPRVDVLRDFRDRVLLRTEWGRKGVAIYYRLSPPIAAAIREHDALRAAVRLLLFPLVYAVRYPIAALVAATLLLGLLGRLIASPRRLVPSADRTRRHLTARMAPRFR